MDLLDNNPELEKIKINLTFPINDTKNEEKLYKSLIKAISKLKRLKKLKLSLNVDDPILAVDDHEFPIQELYKLENIEEISFESNCMTTQMWDDFIDLSKHFGSTLKKLKLDLVRITPDMSYLKQLRSFIRSLTAIEVLELKRFEIPSMKFWKKFVNYLTELKKLRKLELGKIHITKQELDQETLEIISMTSLQTIKYSGGFRYEVNIENQLARKQPFLYIKKILTYGNYLSVNFLILRHPKA